MSPRLSTLGFLEGRLAEAFNKMQLSVSISHIVLLLYGLLSYLRLLTTSDKPWHLPETVFSGLIYTHCCNHPLVPSGKTWDIASQGRVGVELKSLPAPSLQKHSIMMVHS